MSEGIDEEAKARLKEFNIEFELLVASMLQGVPVTAIKKFYGSDDMSQIVARIMAPIVRHARRR